MNIEQLAALAGCCAETIVAAQSGCPVPPRVFKAVRGELWRRREVLAPFRFDDASPDAGKRGSVAHGASDGHNAKTSRGGADGPSIPLEDQTPPGLVIEQGPGGREVVR